MLGSAVCIPALTLYAAPAGAALSLPLLQGVLYAVPAALLSIISLKGTDSFTMPYFRSYDPFLLASPRLLRLPA
jgi:hypothetical protein